jgi:hypothetical protein
MDLTAISLCPRKDPVFLENELFKTYLQDRISIPEGTIAKLQAKTQL